MSNSGIDRLRTFYERLLGVKESKPIKFYAPITSGDQDCFICKYWVRCPHGDNGVTQPGLCWYNTNFDMSGPIEDCDEFCTTDGY